MPLRTERLEDPQLILTPFIDILIFLVIFFMLGTSFKRAEGQYPVELPTTADAQPLTARPDAISITVISNGEIRMNGKVRTLAELETDLVAARKNYPDQEVVIRGEGAGPYQNVVDVLAVICDRARIRSVSLAVRLKVEDRR